MPMIDTDDLKPLSDAAQINEKIYNQATRKLATHVNAVLAKHQLG